MCTLCASTSCVSIPRKPSRGSLGLLSIRGDRPFGRWVTRVFDISARCPPRHFAEPRRPQPKATQGGWSRTPGPPRQAKGGAPSRLALKGGEGGGHFCAVLEHSSAYAYCLRPRLRTLCDPSHMPAQSLKRVPGLLRSTSPGGPADKEGLPPTGTTVVPAPYRDSLVLDPLRKVIRCRIPFASLANR